MTIIEQFCEEMRAYIVKYGQKYQDFLVKLPPWAYQQVEDESSRYVAFGTRPPQSIDIVYYSMYGTVTFCAARVERAEVCTTDGYMFHAYDLAKVPVLIGCKHQWVVSHGLFRSYSDCSKCGAKHEDLQHAV